MILFSCLDLLSLIELCVANFCVSMLAKRLSERTTLIISFVLKGFPYKDQIEE